MYSRLHDSVSSNHLEIKYFNSDFTLDVKLHLEFYAIGSLRSWRDKLAECCMGQIR